MIEAEIVSKSYWRHVQQETFLWTEIILSFFREVFFAFVMSILFNIIEVSEFSYLLVIDIKNGTVFNHDLSFPQNHDSSTFLTFWF